MATRGLLAIVTVMSFSSSAAATKPPPVVALVELKVRSTSLKGKPLDKKVRLAHPKGWTGDVDPDGRAVRLYGPDGEGEILIAAVGHPSELGEYLQELKARHPAAAPSPPQHAVIRGISEEKGERATRFVITGREVGEMVMIERGEVIILFAAVVRPEDWPEIQAQLLRCYPTVEVVDRVPQQ
jgi:hypothetical protein